jgi:hypothetical protein
MNAGMKINPDRSDHDYGLPTLQVYNSHVQRLYKYGMYVCEDRELVLNAIMQLFVHVQSQGKLLVSGDTLRFCLFKRFRDIISPYSGDGKLASREKGGTNRPLVACNNEANSKLTPLQQEAVFLKLYCQFSYEQVASIMHLDAGWSYKLVTQAFEILPPQDKIETPNAAVYATEFD